MAISWESATHGLLKSWQVRFQVNPFGFNQVKDDVFTGDSPQIFYQPDREIIGNAVSAAYDQATDYLGYSISPQFIAGEMLSFDAPFPLSTLTASTRHFLTAQGLIQGFGKAVRKTATISSITEFKEPARAPADNRVKIVLTANQSDVPDIDEAIQRPMIYFKPAKVNIDGNAFAQYDERLELPVLSATYTLADGTYTITIYTHKADHASPAKQLGARRRSGGGWVDNALDISDDDNYLLATEDFDVGIITRDTSHGEILSYDGGALVRNPVSLEAVNSEAGIFRVLRPANLSGNRLVHALVINYEAGLPLNRMRFDSQLELAVLRLANAGFAHAKSKFSAKAFAILQDDFVDIFDTTSEIQLPVTDRRIVNLGTKRGHFEAYNVFRDRHLPERGKF